MSVVVHRLPLEAFLFYLLKHNNSFVLSALTQTPWLHAVRESLPQLHICYNCVCPQSSLSFSSSPHFSVLYVFLQAAFACFPFVTLNILSPSFYPCFLLSCFSVLCFLSGSLALLYLSCLFLLFCYKCAFSSVSTPRLALLPYSCSLSFLHHFSLTFSCMDLHRHREEV